MFASGIAKAFRRWSEFVSRRPYAVIVFTTVFALIWGFAFMLQFEQERDHDDLFTPDDARSFDDKAYVDEVYGAYTARVCHF